MDEIRAIEKTVSELKTIQNRLKKVLKDREWALSHEIPRLEAIIKEKESEIESLLNSLSQLKIESESKNNRLKEMQSQYDESKKERRQFEEDNKKLREVIIELKSDYLYRSLSAKNQFLEEKLDQLKGKMAVQEKAALGNYKDFEKIVAQYRHSLGVEIKTLERRNKELEKMNGELLKENVNLRKQINNNQYDET